MAARGGSHGSRVGVALAVLGCVGLLGGAFAAGVVVGRHWPRVQVSTGLVKPRATTEATMPTDRSASPGRAVPGTAPPARAAAPADAVPRLTFYEELTSPVEAPGRSAETDTPKRGTTREALPAPAKSEPRPGVDAGHAMAPTSGRRDRPWAASPSGGPPRAHDGFTVQVATYRARAAADALRARLAGQGFDANVTAVETDAGRRYRVRVGTFSTRDGASAFAERLVSQAKVTAVVVTRESDSARPMADHAWTERDRGVTAR